MNTQTDAHYIELTIQGDTNAFAHLVEKYQHMVFTLCYRIVKVREEAEEVAQDVFVKAFSNLRNFKGESKFSTWLYRIAYYGSLDAVRRSGRTVNSEHLDQVNEGNLGPVQNGLEYLEEQERRQVITEALSRLNEDERTIMTLFYFEELPIREISKIMRQSNENVKVKLHRSRKKLHGLLSPVVEPRTMKLL
jgi:RNA polymerase sigma factor (sigma-70 family)